MFGSTAPAALLTHNLDVLAAQLPSVRDGAEDAIHQSRVAIRRTREALALAHNGEAGDELAEIEDRLSRGFRALGRVRDADIAQRLVQHVESLFSAPATLGYLRAAVAAEQAAARRKAVKKLEALQFELLPEQLRRARLSQLRRGRDWRSSLRRHVALRAEEVCTAVQHASGVYLPNRAHSARLSIKHLRYALEFADATGLWRGQRALRTLCKSQEALGEAHDREVLLTRLGDLLAAGVELKQAEADGVAHFVRGEAMAQHRKFVDHRDDILDICAACARVPHRRLRPARALLIAGAAVPSWLLLRRHAT